MFRAFAAATLALSLMLRVATAEPPASAPSAGWHDDLRTLVETLSTKHKNAFTKVSREQFEAAAKGLDARLDSLTDWQIYLEMKRLVAMVGDGHTMLDDSKGRFPRRFYPFSVLLLKEGVYITATTEAQRPLLGMRITRIGSTSIDEAITKLGAIIPHENRQWLLNQVRLWIMSPDALAFVGVIDDMDHASFTLADASRKETTVVLAPMLKTEQQTPDPQLTQDKLALTLRQRANGQVYGSMMLPDSRDLYIWYDACSDAKDKTVAQFAQETLAAIEREKPEKIIIDLRRNGGGNSALIQPLVKGLASREAASGGKIFALIGRSTFSSGVWAAEDLKKQARAILLGEPTGGKPNSFGEQRSVDLPHSGLTLRYSTKKWTRDPDGDPENLNPDVLAEQTYADLIAGRDAALEAARAYKP